ncbi:MAG: oligosaccharide flippase family protein [Candidatus Korobacteraceae bacterium]|jgi:O-antigen/teichoic acid export membrane protein
MLTFLSPLMRKMLRLGSGEALARLCSVITLVFLAHRFGVVVVGVYALSQTMLLYSQPFIDFGMKHVGARLVARYPQAAKTIMHRVQRRRITMALVLLPLLLVYAVSTRLPWSLRACLLAIAAISPLYALSLDWLAWAKERLGLAGLGRSVIPIVVLVCVLLGRHSANVLWWVVLGQLIGILLHSAILWVWWKSQKHAEDEVLPLPQIHESLAWQRTSILGLATLCNLAFNSIDMLMLGVMSNPREVGLYSASYRVVNQVFFTYYLLTQVLYPQLARQDAQQRVRMLSPRVLLALAAVGTALATVLTLTRRPVLGVLFGPQFLPATLLLLLLAWAIPLDFLTSYLNNAYLAWGMEKKLLLCTIIAAGSNVILNLIWIPIYGAAAAAANTLVSYVLYLVSLGFVARYAKELASSRQQPVVAPA